MDCSAAADRKRTLFFDLSRRVKLRITGADRLRWLNGQVTNDVRKLSAEMTIAACVLNARGKMDAHIFISARTDYMLVDSDAALHDSLIARFDRYVIADDVMIEDVTDEFSIFHSLTEMSPNNALQVTSADRFGLPGFDVWISRSASHELVSGLGSEWHLCNDVEAETFRIEQGVPAWGRELTGDTIPVEAHLEESCIDYAKGCYIGQEIISRMKMSGQKNKSLHGLVTQSSTAMAEGMKLFATEATEKEIGWITSAAWSDRFRRHLALGYVRRPFNVPGSTVYVHLPGAGATALTIVQLPFSRGLAGAAGPA